jgi:thioredoxin reductase
VVLALGRRGTPRKLDVAGEELPKVMYQLTDAESYEGRRLLIVGGGDSAVEAAIGLARQPRNWVTLSYRREKLVRIKKKNEERFAALLAQRRVEAVFSSEVEEIRAGAVRLKTAGGSATIANDYVFVFAGGDPPFGLLRQMGVRFGGEAGPGKAAGASAAPRPPAAGSPLRAGPR